jgi:hypothetical protein
MMKDNTWDAFRVQEEKKGGESGAVDRGIYQGGPRGGYEHGRGWGYGGGGSIPPTCFNCSVIDHVSWFYTKSCVIYTYFYSPKHLIEDFPYLLKKWEEKKGNCNMVHVEPHKNHKKKGEGNINIVTHRGVNIGGDFEPREISGK